MKPSDVDGIAYISPADTPSKLQVARGSHSLWPLGEIT